MTQTLSEETPEPLISEAETDLAAEDQDLTDSSNLTPQSDERLATPLLAHTKAPFTRGWGGMLAGVGIGVVITSLAMQGMTRHPDAPGTPEPGISVISSAATVGTVPTVTIASVESTLVNRTLDATGTVMATDLLPILPQTTGLQIQQVLVDEGDVVTTGQVMAVLDDAVLRTQLDQAQAQLESAKAALVQAQVQVQQSRSNQRETEAGREQSRATVEQAQAGIAQAEARVMKAEAEVSQAQAGVEQARAGIAQAQARLEQAQRELERSQNLADQGVISRQDLEIRRTDVRTAQEDVNRALEELTKAQKEVYKAEEEVRVAQANVRTAQANLKTAQAGVSSSQAKVETAITSIESNLANVKNAEANVRSYSAQVERLQTQLQQTLVRAPRNGVVAERMARVGDVTGNEALFSLIRDQQLELHLRVPETQLPAIKIGTAVKVTSDADSRIQVEGRVKEIAPLVDAQSRQATVKIDLPANELLRPGMFLRGAVTTERSPGLVIPAQAVLPQGEGRALVYVLGSDNTVKGVPVEVGEVMGEVTDLAMAKVEVKQGLKPGDKVVVAGAGYLKDGDRVEVVDQRFKFTVDS